MLQHHDMDNGPKVLSKPDEKDRNARKSCKNEENSVLKPLESTNKKLHKSYIVHQHYQHLNCQLSLYIQREAKVSKGELPAFT